MNKTKTGKPMNYRDLTGDDVLQAGDEVGCVGVLESIPKHWIGTRCGELTSWNKKWTFRRPLTPADITAEHRKRFEREMCDILQGMFSDPFSKSVVRLGCYSAVTVELMWQSFCKAVNCDPMGDV